jgi:hypothetical protein
MPAPPEAIAASFDIASNAKVSVSAMIKYAHRPNLGSTWDSSVGPDEVIHIFVIVYISYNEY